MDMSLARLLVTLLFAFSISAPCFDRSCATVLSSDPCHSEKVEKDDLSIPKYVWSTSDDQHFDGRGEARLAKET